MAIKIQGTEVVTDGRVLQNITDADAGTKSVFASTPAGLETVTAGGQLLHTLNNPNAYSTSTNDRFAKPVAIDGNYAIAGAHQEDDTNGTASGKAYIFNAVTGELLHTLNNPNAYSTSLSDFFGDAVGISGNYAIVGARGEDDDGGSVAGKAYIFNVITGALVHTLDNPNGYSTSNADYFGFSVAISGNYAIVGAYQEDDTNGTASGKAYVFNVTTGALVHTLDNPNAYSTSADDQFSHALAISGNYAVIGAYQEDDAGGSSSGKAYIFNVATGELLHTLDNPNDYSTSNLDVFAESVSISGNYAIVSARQEDDADGFASGKAYIFNVTTGALVHTLDNPSAYSTSNNDNFGRAVAISGNYAIVTASGEDDSGGSTSGKAYIFNVTTGALVHTLDNPNAYSTSNADNFGLYAAIGGNYAIVGAWQEDDAGGASSGSAYIFTVDTVVNVVGVDKIKFKNGNALESTSKLFDNALVGGQLVHTLDNPNAYDVSAGDLFGADVAISGNYAIVGAQQEDDADGTSSGKAYIFHVTTGELVHTLDNPNAYSTSASDNFGSRVAIHGNYAIVGAFIEDDSGGSTSGKAYIFNVMSGELVYTLDNPNDYSTSATDGFGSRVAISANYAVVGTWQEDSIGEGFGATNVGVVYVFSLATGQLVRTINNPNAYSTDANDRFGWMVAMSGNYLVASANFEDEFDGTTSGKVYVFDVETGDLIHTLDNPNAYSTVTGDEFGAAIAIDGNYLIASADAEDADNTGINAGKAYIFNVATGELVHTLDNPNAYSVSQVDSFGWAVGISGNYAIVSTFEEDDAGGSSSGKAYIFNVTTGELVHTLDNPNAYSTSADDDFGIRVEIDGNYAIVGANGEDDAGGAGSGKAYIFAVENLTYLDKLITLVS